MKPSHRVSSSGVALACLAVTLAASQEAFAQICRPVSARTGEVGCWITANAALGQLPQPPIFWHLDTYPTRAEAEAAKGPRGGFLLLAAFFILARLFSENYPSATTWATIAFVLLWLFVTSANMWVGVNKAGYSAAEELPILLLLFGVPAVVAIVLKWKLL